MALNTPNGARKGRMDFHDALNAAFSPLEKEEKKAPAATPAVPMFEMEAAKPEAPEVKEPPKRPEKPKEKEIKTAAPAKAPQQDALQKKLIEKRKKGRGVQKSIYLDADVYDTVDSLARQYDTNFSFIINESLKEYFGISS